MRLIPKTEDMTIVIKEACDFFINFFGIQKIELKVQFQHMPSSWMGKHKGYVKQIGFPQDNKFLMVVNSDSDFYQVMTTVAHEMVHIYQFSRGDLSTGKNGRILWKNKSLMWVPYSCRPWEWEAFGNEVRLLQMYLERAGYPPMNKLQLAQAHLIGLSIFIDMFCNGAFLAFMTAMAISSYFGVRILTI